MAEPELIALARRLLANDVQDWRTLSQLPRFVLVRLVGLDLGERRLPIPEWAELLARWLPHYRARPAAAEPTHTLCPLARVAIYRQRADRGESLFREGDLPLTYPAPTGRRRYVRRPDRTEAGKVQPCQCELCRAAA